jgi:hypothetical protein
MSKCPDCAEENINESLFCKHCGRCLLAPDPEKVQRSTVTHIEHHKIHEGVYLYDGQTENNSRVVRLERSHHTVPPVIVGWLLFLSTLVVIFVADIVMDLVR